MKKKIVLALVSAMMIIVLSACSGAPILGFDDCFYDYERTVYEVTLYGLDGEGKEDSVNGVGTLTNSMMKIGSDEKIADRLFVEKNLGLIKTENFSFYFNDEFNDMKMTGGGWLLHTYLEVVRNGQADLTDTIETVTLFYKGANKQNFFPHSSYKNYHVYQTEGSEAPKLQEFVIFSKYESAKQIKQSYEFKVLAGENYRAHAQSGSLSGLAYPTFDNEQALFGIRSFEKLDYGFSSRFQLGNALDDKIHTLSVDVMSEKYDTAKDSRFINGSHTFNLTDINGTARSKTVNKDSELLDVRANLYDINAGDTIMLVYLKGELIDPPVIIEGATSYPFTVPAKNVLIKMEQFAKTEKSVYMIREFSSVR
jgi:hypothetical protein